jgi:hypothetical protein
MKFGVLVAAFSVVVSGSANASGEVRIEQASAGRPYDLVVHVANVPTYGYNPEVSNDRKRMALQVIRPQCPAARVVGQNTINTEIYGITSSKPDYVVLVSCNLQPARPQR